MKNGLLHPIHQETLGDMLSIPTAPFAEHMVIDYVVRYCQARPGVSVSRDAVGNVLVHFKRGKRRVTRPVCITAHLDHPGFVADKMMGKSKLRAFWRGGVPVEYFVGSKVQFWVNKHWVKGKVRSIKKVQRNGQPRVDTALIDVSTEVPTGAIGMWDLPDPKIKGDRIYARACDDLAGASAMLCCIDTLSRSKHSCEAYFLFTRAEEVGFVGAIAACKLGTIPKKCFLVAMETSSELPHAKMGDGPILRVGDRASVFTKEVTAYCHRIARDLDLAYPDFHFQRKLMDGGTCESSAFCALGQDATGLCIALGNYHNVNAKRKTLGPEYVSLRDFDNVVNWFIELARAPRPFTGRDDTLIDQIKDLEKTYQDLLHDSVEEPC